MRSAVGLALDRAFDHEADPERFADLAELDRFAGVYLDRVARDDLEFRESAQGR